MFLAACTIAECVYGALQGPIQLSEAAEHLIGEQTSAKRQQTQITVERRLYDIGSILATLNLIQRTYIEGKRCAFLPSLLRSCQKYSSSTFHKWLPIQHPGGHGFYAGSRMLGLSSHHLHLTTPLYHVGTSSDSCSFC